MKRLETFTRPTGEQGAFTVFDVAVMLVAIFIVLGGAFSLGYSLGYLAAQALTNWT